MPASSPVRWTTSKDRSVSIAAAFFGQATQSRPAGSSARTAEGKRRRRSASLVVNSSTTSSGPLAVRANDVPLGTGPREKPLGAPTTSTREPSRIPSLRGSGVDE